MTVTAKCYYHMENADAIRDELIKEAVNDAKGIADTLIGTFGKKITGVRQIEYYRIEFVPVSESKNGYSYGYYENGKDHSPTRKAVVRVRASFAHN